MALNGIVGDLYLAVLAGFIATIVAAVVCNTIMVKVSGAGPDVSRIPTVVIVFAAIASLAGSSAALEVASHSHHQMSSAVWIGALAGLFSSILMGFLMVAYLMKPGEASHKRRKH
jgi:drug/metabolite transporter (DMT)-like permease